MFCNPAVENDKDKLNAMIQFGKCDEKNLKEFLCFQKGFGDAKVDAGITKLKKW